MLVPCRQGFSVTLQHKHTHTQRVMAGCQNSPEQWLWSFYEPPESWFPLNVALKLESTQYYYHTVNTPTALKRLRLIYMTALGRYVMVIFHWRMLTAINHRCDSPIGEHKQSSLSSQSCRESGVVGVCDTRERKCMWKEVCCCSMH